MDDRIGANLTSGHYVLELGVLVDAQADDVIRVFQIKRLVSCKEWSSGQDLFEQNGRSSFEL